MSRSVKCRYCSKGYATIVCCDTRCKTFYHFGCGEEKSCQYEFFDRYESFCPKHIKIVNDVVHEPNYKCFICWHPIEKYHPTNSIPTCCVGWSHRKCVKKWTYAQGHDIKCLSCGGHKTKSLEGYKRMLEKRGVYVPDHSSAVDRTTDPYYRPVDVGGEECKAEECRCVLGRAYDDDDEQGEWRIISCCVCGDVKSGKHRGCITDGKYDFLCGNCEPSHTERAGSLSVGESDASRPLQDLERDLVNETEFSDRTPNSQDYEKYREKWATYEAQNKNHQWYIEKVDREQKTETFVLKSETGEPESEAEMKKFLLEMFLGDHTNVKQANKKKKFSFI